MSHNEDGVVYKFIIFIIQMFLQQRWRVGLRTFVTKGVHLRTGTTVQLSCRLLYGNFVELIGIEPTTSSLRTMRSPS